MASLDTSSFIPSVDSISSFASTLIWGIIISILISVIIIFIRNKLKYQYYSHVFKLRQEDFGTKIPSSKRVKGKSGYFISKGRTVFRIKYGYMPWQQIELTKLPDPKYMIDNEVYYLQLQKDNYVQAKMEIDWEGKFNLEPVEDDLKYGAQLDISEKERILNTKSSWEKFGAPVTMGLVLVAGIIAFYFNSKACGA